MKQKTHSGAKKRIQITKGGKVRVARPNKGHLLLQKSKRSKRQGLRNETLHGKMADKMRKMLPNG